jgi:hypothetical protein
MHSIAIFCVCEVGQRIRTGKTQTNISEAQFDAVINSDFFSFEKVFKVNGCISLLAIKPVTVKRSCKDSSALGESRARL